MDEQGKRMTAKAPDNNQYVSRITRLLEVLTMRGVRQNVIFDDWIGICYHSLRMLPAHVRHVREHGTPAPDDEEAAAYWGRLRGGCSWRARRSCRHG